MVATKKGVLLGFTSLLENYYIHHLYVNHLYLGKGIALQLVDHVEDLAKMQKSTELKSDVSITALPFFEKRGYKVMKKK